MHWMGAGVYSAALTSVLGHPLLGDTKLASEPGQQRRPYNLKPKAPPRPATAKSVIQLFMNGGPSQMDLFDPKPELAKREGQGYFKNIAGEVENPTEAGALMGSPFQFKQHGQSGMWVSDAMPHFSKCVDDVTMIRSMHTINITHEPAIYKIQSGGMLPGLPTMGAWISYGLGTENQDLPAYVVLEDPKGLPINGTQNWQCGFLPPIFQGTRFRSNGAPILNLQRKFDQPESIRTEQAALISELDQIHRDDHPGYPQLDARLSSYELAARMQLSTSDALNIAQESSKTLELYGIGKEPTDSYGRRCLYARRLVERGVRFVQLFIDGQIWDNHSKIATDLKSACDRTDKPIAALLTDLKDRGLIDETLVLWGGEMGRLPIAQIGKDKPKHMAGRDHNKQAMCAWMAGGGVKAGYVHGETDELGFAATHDKVSVTQWHATVLRLLGLDHHQLTFHRNGLDERLTGVEEVQPVAALIS